MQEVFPSSDGDDYELGGAIRQVIARQILRDNPAAVWETAQRLLGLGLDREVVMGQLVIAFIPLIEARLDDDDAEAGGPDYEALLAQLPLTTEKDVVRTIMSVLASSGPIAATDLEAAVIVELGAKAQSAVMQQLLDTIMDRLILDEELAYLPDDYVVVPEWLCTGIVLTTRLISADGDAPIDTDFAGFEYLADELGELPADVLPGELLIARHLSGEIAIERAPAPLPVRDEEIAEVLRAYEAETREPGLSASFGDLVINLLGNDPSYFSQPRAPLSEIVAAAGLEIRGSQIAADACIWRADAYNRCLTRIVDRAADEGERRAAIDVLIAFQMVAEDELHERVSVAGLRRVLDLMFDSTSLKLITDQLFGQDDDSDLLEGTADFARRLTAAASRPDQRATAAWLTAMVAERRCDPLAAADALAEAVRQAPDFLPAVDRLAWTRSDQGRYADAIALWRQLGSKDHPGLVMLERLTTAVANPAAQGLRRNAPCWCGSGRKFKVCHLRVTELPPLPYRMPWLLAKTSAYLQCCRDSMHDVVGGVAWKLTGEQLERTEEALADPLVYDVVLHELGWLERFLAERGALLPEDEQLLFASWLLVSRSVYEVADVRRRDGVTLRDLRTGDVVEVRDRTFSQVASVGQLICALPLPDGHSHQLSGAVFDVPPGREKLLIDILDDPKPASRADWLLTYRAAAKGLRRWRRRKVSHCARVS